MTTYSLTILTGVELTVLLVALAVALVLIRHALESIARTLEKIAWGVRAIETETAPLPPQIGRLNTGLSALSGGLKQAAVHFIGADRSLKSVVAALGKNNA